MAISAVVAVKAWLILMICTIFVGVANVIYHNDATACFDLGESWAAAILADFIITLLMIQAWIFYKEPNWILRAIFMVITFCIGSAAISLFILVQISRLSSEEISKDLSYYLLAKRHKRDVGGPSIVTVRIARVFLSTAIGTMVGVLIYTIIVYGSPFHIELYTGPCMESEVLDRICTLCILYAWIRYKESSWISSFLWILSITCFGSIVTCVYMLRELSYLSPEQPVSHVLFNRTKRDLMSSEPLLNGNANV